MQSVPVGSMEYHEAQSVGWLTFPSFDGLPFLRHAFSTRLGGVSTGEFASMNLNFGRGDPRETVQEKGLYQGDGYGLDRLEQSEGGAGSASAGAEGAILQRHPTV